MKKFWQTLFRTEFASFSSPYSPEQAARRLSASVKPTVLRTPFRSAMVGRASASRVRLYRHHAALANYLVPMFTGSFTIQRGVTTLEGRFSTHWTAQTYTLLYFGILTVFFLVVIAAFLLRKASAEDLLLVLALLVAGAGFGAAGFSRDMRRAHSDVAFISEHIRKSIGSIEA